MAVITNSTVVTTRLPISISWRSVFAGTAFALASAWIMYLFGSALGFSMIDPYSQDPTNGLGYAAAAWIFITWLVSLFLGGLLAGRLSEHADRASGFIHGILVWSVCIILTITLGVAGVKNLLQAGGELIKNTGTAAAIYTVGTKSSANNFDTTPQGVNTLALESDIKQQISQISSTTPQNQPIVSPNTTQRSVNQLTNDQLMQVAGYLLTGNVDAAKSVLALNTDLSADDINKITDNLNDKVTQYKQNIKDYADKVTAYTAAVLWVILMSNLFSLLAAIIGGWLGIHTVARVYGRPLY
jgi:hypothetical protein